METMKNLHQFILQVGIIFCESLGQLNDTKTDSWKNSLTDENKIMNLFQTLVVLELMFCCVNTAGENRNNLVPLTHHLESSVQTLSQDKLHSNTSGKLLISLR